MHSLNSPTLLSQLKVLATQPADRSAPEYPSFPIGKGLTGAAIRTRRTINVGDVSSDSRYLTAFGSTKSEIIVPISDTREELVIGTIDIESEDWNAFDAETERALEECSKQISSLWRVEG